MSPWYMPIPWRMQVYSFTYKPSFQRPLPSIFLAVVKLVGQELIVISAFLWQVVKMVAAETLHWPVNASMVGWAPFVTVLLAKRVVIWSMDIAINLMNVGVNLDGVDLIVIFVSNILVVLRVGLVLKLGTVFVKMTLKVLFAQSKPCLESMIVMTIHT